MSACLLRPSRIIVFNLSVGVEDGYRAWNLQQTKLFTYEFVSREHRTEQLNVYSEQCANSNNNDYNGFIFSWLRL